jgi:hypothetical protein
MRESKARAGRRNAALAVWESEGGALRQIPSCREADITSESQSHVEAGTQQAHDGSVERELGRR